MSQQVGRMDGVWDSRRKDIQQMAADGLLPHSGEGFCQVGCTERLPVSLIGRSDQYGLLSILQLVKQVVTDNPERIVTFSLS